MNEFIDISYRSLTKIAHQGILNGIIVSAKNYAKGELIDLGCGIKPYEAIFSKYISNYFGVDHHQTANKNYADSTKADLYVDCTNTGLKSESYDTLLSTQVMEHIYDTDKYLDECYRLLKKNGYGIFTVPFFWQLHSEPYDYFRFTYYGLERLFSAKKFQIVKIEPLEGAFAALIQAKIVSLYIHCKNQNLLIQYIRKIQLKFWVPILNYFAIRFDKIFYNDKLCINYLIIVKKQ